MEWFPHGYPKVFEISTALRLGSPVALGLFTEAKQDGIIKNTCLAGWGYTLLPHHLDQL